MPGSARPPTRRPPHQSAGDHRAGTKLVGVLASGSEEEAKQLLAPILSVGNPDVSMSDGSWADTYAGFQIPPADEAANWKFVSQFISEPFPAEAISLIGPSCPKPPHRTAITSPMPSAGVMGTEPAGGSVFAHRNALYYAEPGAGWGDRGPVTCERRNRPAHCRVRHVDRRVHPSLGALRQRRLRQRAECRHGGLGDRLLGSKRRPAAHDQGEVRPRQRVQLRTEHSTRGVAMTRGRLAISAAVVGLVVQLAAPGTATAEPRRTARIRAGSGCGPPPFRCVSRERRLRSVRHVDEPEVGGAGRNDAGDPHADFGGTTARIRLSNRFGAVAVTFAQATIGRRASGPALVPDTTASLTFAGDRSVAVPPGRTCSATPSNSRSRHSSRWP